MQNKYLKNFSDVVSGYTFREALSVNEEGDIKVLLAKNINKDCTVNYSDFVRIGVSLPRTNSFIEKNDVIISARGTFKAGVFLDESKNVVASSSVFILRIKCNDILPEYLAIYLNSDAGQGDIQKNLTGGSIKTILRKSLEDLSVPVPALSVQKMIIDIHNNWKKREGLLNKKINLGKNIAGGAIKHLLTT